MSTSLTLLTPRLRLDRIEDGDLDALCRIQSDPEVMRWITGNPRTEEMVREFMGRSESLWRHRGFGQYMVRRRETGAAIGYGGYLLFKQPPLLGEVEIGYVLERAAWGQGFATEIAKALLDNALGPLRLPRVYATIVTTHIASQKVVLKLGIRFVREGDFDNFPCRLYEMTQADRR